MAAERYDSLLKVWPLLTLSEFYFTEYMYLHLHLHISNYCNICKGACHKFPNKI